MFFKYILTLFICVLCMRSCHTSVRPIASHVVNRNITNAIKTFFLNQVQQQNDTLYLYVHFNREIATQKYYFNDLVSALLKEYNNSLVYVNFHSMATYKSVTNYELILVDTLDALRYVYEKLQQLGTNNFPFVLIYFIAVRKPNDYQIKAALNMLWQMSTLNVGILVELPQQELVVVSYYPYSTRSCGIIRPVIINRFDSLREEWLSKAYFPEKLNNFFGCPINVATFDNMPYVGFAKNTRGRQAYLEGIEGGLMNFIASNLNFTISVYVMSKDDEKDTYNESSTVFQRIFRDSADVAIAGFNYRTVKSDHFSQTVYYSISHIYLITNLLNAYTAYEKLMHPFQTIVWLLFAFTLLLGCAVIAGCNYTHGNRRAFLLGQVNTAPCYNMFVIAVGGNSSVPLPRRNFSRFLLAVWFLATLVIRAAYQSGLYEILRDNTQKNPPQTIKDVMEQNYLVELVPENARYLPKLGDVEEVRFINTSDMEAFPAVAFAKKRTALLTTYEYYGNFVIRQRLVSQHLYKVPDRIFAQQSTIYVRLNSYLINVLDEQVKNSQTYGFIEKWKLRYVVRRREDAIGGGGLSYAMSYKQTVENDNDGRNILSMSELEAIFMILLWLHIGAIGLFLLELYIQKKPALFALYEYLHSYRNRGVLQQQ